MVATKRDCTLPLPHGWPRRVRSAVVHAISLAHASMTANRGWAANNWNARVCLFVAREFRRWCRRHAIRQRFGAIGKYGSLAVIERCIRTLKTECTRRLTTVPYRRSTMGEEPARYCSWYNNKRPHTRLGAVTPDEIYYRLRPAGRAPRFEPRPRWPRRSSPCASPRLSFAVSRESASTSTFVISVRAGICPSSR